MTTGMRTTLPRPQQGGWHALPGVILAVLILGALAAGAIYISTQKTDLSPITGRTPTDLITVRDELPRFEGMVDYQPDVYSGGNSMEAIYFSNVEAEQVADFYQQQMLKAGWTQVDAPHGIINTNPRAIASTASYEFKATNDHHTVTITARETNENLTAGSTQITAHIERN